MPCSLRETRPPRALRLLPQSRQCRDPGAARIRRAVRTYSHGPSVPVQMQWPGPDRAERGYRSSSRGRRTHRFHAGPMGAVPAFRQGADLAGTDTSRSPSLSAVTAQPSWSPGSAVNPFSLNELHQVPLSWKDLMASNAEAAPGYHGKLPTKAIHYASPAARLPRSLGQLVAGCHRRQPHPHGRSVARRLPHQPIWRFALPAVCAARRPQPAS